MPIHSNKNLYPGINAHLNSFKQNTQGEWESFHNLHVSHLYEAFEQQLPSGYFPRIERSLQIGVIDFEIGTRRQNPTKPDVTVYRRTSAVVGESAAVTQVSIPMRTLSLPETVEYDESITSLVIYQIEKASLLGTPITRIELLSPANKPGGSHYGQYFVKRGDTLKSGLRLVEIDYLHQTPPIISALPSYPRKEAGAYPYVILVSDPRPTFEQGLVDDYSFGVDTQIPIIDVPLAGTETLRVDFGAVYNHTFGIPRFYHSLIDYAQDPPAFDRYTEADRERIQQLLAKIRADHDSNESQ